MEKPMKLQTNVDRELTRCKWVTINERYCHYHDTEWGRPVLDSQTLFAKLCLEGQQAGLSWITILNKTEDYYAAYYNFDPSKIVSMDQSDIEGLLQNKGIVRNRMKIHSIVSNARAYLTIEERQPFSEFIWQFSGGKTIINGWRDHNQVPVVSPESDRMSKSLKDAGFNFVGSKICYAFMQAVGMVNDHTTDCHCYEEVKALAIR